MRYRIAHDRELSTKDNDVYFVFDTGHLNAVIYSGKYIQCLCVIGALSLDPDITLDEIDQKTGNFLYA